MISDWLTTSLCALAVAVGGQVISDYNGYCKEVHIVSTKYTLQCISYSLVVWAIGNGIHAFLIMVVLRATVHL